MIAAWVLEAKLGEDRAHVLLYRANADKHCRSDARVRAALGHQLKHLTLATGEGIDRMRNQNNKGQAYTQA